MSIPQSVRAASRSLLLASVFAALLLCGGVTVDPLLATATPAAAATLPKRQTMTYYYYWYDAYTSTHLHEAEGLTFHMPLTPTADWHSVAWHKQQLSDMSYAGIDIVLPVYWGTEHSYDTWSWLGLPVLAEAQRQLQAEGKNPPKIGLFLDTTIVNFRDLTTSAGHDWFYAQFSNYFRAIPRAEWATIDGRPVVYLFTSDYTGAMNQATFDDVYARFTTEFGVRPYIVSEQSWSNPILGWKNGVRIWDRTTAVRTDSTYLWGAAMHGYNDYGDVATVGPGYDDHLVPGRGAGTVVPRANGSTYVINFRDALWSGKSLLAIETWNELHEGSGIAETLEYGRYYIELTRQLTSIFHNS